MKRSHALFFIFALILVTTAYAVVLTACGGDDDDDDVTNYGNLGGVWGMVRGTDGLPMEGVSVMIADGLGTTEVTDSSGVYKIAGVALGENLVVKFEKEGYATTFKNLKVFASVVSTLQVVMKPVDAIATFDADADVSESFGNGNNIAMLGSSLVDSEGNPAEGDVKISMTSYDVADEGEILAAPGNFTAVQSNGTSAMIESFGMVDINFTQDGEPLQLAEGEVAEIEFALPSNSTKEEGDEIPLWYFDEDDGKWVEEGSCVVTLGTNSVMVCVGEVSHFSSWNSDQTFDTTCVRGRVVDDANQPISGAEIYGQGRDYNGTSTEYSREDGTFEIPLKRASEAGLTFTKEDNRRSDDIDTPDSDSSECEDLGDINISGWDGEDPFFDDMLGFDPDDDPSDIACGLICG